MNGTDAPQQKPVPKRYCMITLMFPINDDKEALDVKTTIDVQVQNMPDKRYTFQIVDN